MGILWGSRRLRVTPGIDPLSFRIASYLLMGLPTIDSCHVGLRFNLIKPSSQKFYIPNIPNIQHSNIVDNNIHL